MPIKLYLFGVVIDAQTSIRRYAVLAHTKKEATNIMQRIANVFFYQSFEMIQIQHYPEDKEEHIIEMFANQNKKLLALEKGKI
jgi:hypothetical protein